jgi:hypothetical protein
LEDLSSRDFPRHITLQGADVYEVHANC